MPGKPVYIAPAELLKKFYSYPEDEALNIGYLITRSEVPVSLSIKGFRRHLAIIAQTGAGKTYLSGIIVEELLRKGGTIVMLDPLADYMFLSRTNDGRRHDLSDRITVFRNPASTGRYTNVEVGKVEPYEICFSDLSLDEICLISGINEGYTNIRSGLEVAFSLIEAGKNHKVEFKSSLIWDYMKNNKNEELGVVAAKVVCAFMNSDGGTLIIGVSDDKKMLGLENDLKQLKQSSLDVFQQHFVNTINKYLGKTCCPLAKMSFEKILEKDLAIVEVEKSPSPVWIKYKDSTGEKEEFYVRSGNSNQPLNAHEAHDYIRNHWPQH